MGDLTPAQAILAVLGPIGTFLAAVVTLFVRRHLQHFDVLEKHLDATRALDGEIAVELRLSRDAREAQARSREALDTRIVELVRQELTDQRHAELQQLIVERVSRPPDPPVPPHPAEVSGKRRVGQR